MKFVIKKEGRKNPRARSVGELPDSPAILATGFSTKFSPENPYELCDKLRLLLQEKQADNHFDKINQELFAISDKLLEYKCISMKQHKVLLSKCLN